MSAAVVRVSVCALLFVVLFLPDVVLTLTHAVSKNTLVAAMAAVANFF